MMMYWFLLPLVAKQKNILKGQLELLWDKKKIEKCLRFPPRMITIDWKQEAIKLRLVGSEQKFSYKIL